MNKKNPSIAPFILRASPFAVSFIAFRILRMKEER